MTNPTSFFDDVFEDFQFPSVQKPMVSTSSQTVTLGNPAEARSAQSMVQGVRETQLIQSSPFHTSALTSHPPPPSSLLSSTSLSLPTSTERIAPQKENSALHDASTSPKHLDQPARSRNPFEAFRFSEPSSEVRTSASTPVDQEPPGKRQRLFSSDARAPAPASLPQPPSLLSQSPSLLSQHSLIPPPSFLLSPRISSPSMPAPSMPAASISSFSIFSSSSSSSSSQLSTRAIPFPPPMTNSNAHLNSTSLLNSNSNSHLNSNSRTTLDRTSPQRPLVSSLGQPPRAAVPISPMKPTPALLPCGRPIPGPAGLLPPLMQAEHIPKGTFALPPSVLPSAHFDSKQLLHAQDFMEGSWLSMLEALNLPPLCSDEGEVQLLRYNIDYVLRYGFYQKVPKLVVLVKQITQSDVDTTMVVGDPTGTMEGTLHPRVLSDFQSTLYEGSVVILKNVSVFNPTPLTHYLNITCDNIAAVFPARDAHPVCENAFDPKAIYLPCTAPEDPGPDLRIDPDQIKKSLKPKHPALGRILPPTPSRGGRARSPDAPASNRGWGRGGYRGGRGRGGEPPTPGSPASRASTAQSPSMNSPQSTRGALRQFIP